MTHTTGYRGTVLSVGLVAGIAFVCFSQDHPDQPLQFIGTFSNMRYTAEHAYGEAVEVWRDGDLIVGLISVSNGLQGDTPTGILENVRFNSHTGAISFTAKLTTMSGQEIVRGQGLTFLMSHDLFQFSGTLKATNLAGTLKHSVLSQTASPGTPGYIPETRERVRLKIDPGTTSPFSTSSYAAWKREVDPVLKRLGPKW